MNKEEIEQAIAEAVEEYLAPEYDALKVANLMYAKLEEMFNFDLDGPEYDDDDDEAQDYEDEEDE